MGHVILIFGTLVFINIGIGNVVGDYLYGEHEGTVTIDNEPIRQEKTDKASPM